MTTRAALFTAVRNWLRRTNDTELDADLGTMLLNVEARFAREIVHSSMETVTTLTINGRSGTLPTNCLEMRSLTLSSGSFRRMELVNSEVLREGAYWDSSGDPRWYSVQGRDIYIAPAAPALPAAGVQFDLAYYARFPALVNDVDTNYLLTNYFDLYLNAMLHEAAKFIQDEALAMNYLAAYADIRNTLLEQDSSYVHSGSTMRQNRSRFMV